MATSLFFKAPSAAIIPASSGPAAVFVDGTNFDYLVLAFDGADGSANEYCFFFATMPDSYNGGNITARVYWVPAAGSPAGENCSWDVGILGRADDEAFDTAITVSVTINDLVTAAGDLQVASGDITITGSSIVAGDYIIVSVNRDYDEANGGTALGEDAYFVGLQILEV